MRLPEGAAVARGAGTAVPAVRPGVRAAALATVLITLGAARSGSTGGEARRVETPRRRGSEAAPFHPTPAGQQAIAESVVAAVSDLFNTEIPVDTTKTTDATVTTTTTPTTP